MRILVIDFETTGLSTLHDQIVQIGASCFKLQNASESAASESAASESAKYFCTLVKCERKIHANASAVTGITEQTLADAPSTQAALKMFFDFVASCRDGDEPITAIAYNGLGFDFPVLCAEIARTGSKPSALLRAAGIESFVDPMKWAKNGKIERYLKRGVSGNYSYKLGVVYEQIIKKPLVGAHDAKADVAALADLVVHEAFAGMMEAKGDHVKSLADVLLAHEETAKTKKRKWNTISDCTAARKRVAPVGAAPQTSSSDVTR